jgi:hypothetical protein
MKLTIMLATIAVVISFAFGYSLARFNYINHVDKTLTEANSLIMFQRDVCYSQLNSNK